MLAVVAIMTFCKNAFNALSTKPSFLTESGLIIQDKETAGHMTLFFLIIFYPPNKMQIELPAKLWTIK